MQNDPKKTTSPSRSRVFVVGDHGVVRFENGQVWVFADNCWMHLDGRFATALEGAFFHGHMENDLRILAATGLPGAEAIDRLVREEKRKEIGTSLTVEAPSLLFIELTDRCDLKCKHCYTSAGPRGSTYLDRSVVETLITQAGATGYRRVQFTGGEPLLHSDLPQLVQRAFAAHIPAVEIFTNGNLIDAAFLDKIPSETLFALSFYSHDLDVHDRITGVTGSGAKTLAAIDLLVERSFEVRVGSVQMEENADHWQQTREFLIRRGVAEDNVGGSSMSAVGRGDYHPGPDKDPEECVDDGEKGERDFITWPGKACVAANGDVFPCIFARFAKLGNVHQRALSDILQTPDPIVDDALSVPERWNYCAERLSCPDCRFLVFGLMGPNHV
jgi:MoaA/NifB/PqqE/SkfB family radical SAM enzyme